MTRVRPSADAPEVVAPTAIRVPGMPGALLSASVPLPAGAPRSASVLLSAGAPRSAGAVRRAGAAVASVAGVSCRVAR